MASGTVKWFNETSGYGYIEPDAGGVDLYVRGLNIEAAGVTALEAGARVEFERREAGMGPEAVSVTPLPG
jgi:CspA family cold shock protein